MARARILVVEDEAIVAADVTSKLTHLGYDVVGTASRGEQAVTMANTLRPNLVLMDILLSGDMDGVEAADRIRQECPAPIVFLTAHSDSETLARAKVTAPFGYLLKPFSERELETHIEMALYRFQIESALRENEGRLRLAIDATRMGVWDWDIANDRATWAGHHSDLFGLQPDAFNGSTFEFLALLHEEDRETVHAAIQRAVYEPAPYACEFRIRYPDRSIHWLEWWGEVYRDAKQQPVRMVGLLQDITRRREIEEELRRLTDELERRVADRTEKLIRSESRLRALSKELNLTEQRERRKIATDLHDYLAQLLVLARIRLGQAKQDRLPASGAGHIAEAESNIDHALAYTRSLVGQLCPPLLKDFGLAVALKWLAEQMQQHRLAVEVYADETRLTLEDEQEVLLFQSVRELLMNVVKHAQTDAVTVRVEQESGVLRIEVQDQGAGFDLAAAAAESPTTLSSNFGLFNITERMQALGGRFDLHSAPGQGTTATLVLPLAARDKRETRDKRDEQKVNSLPVAPFSPVSQVSHHPPIRVLLVDDHAMIREGLKAVLLDYPGFDIVGEAANGAEAVSLTGTLQPEVVVMDVTMPLMDGIEATRLITQGYPGVTVIGLTLHSAAQVKAAMMEAGASTVLTKEAAVDELPRTIQILRAMNDTSDGDGSGTIPAPPSSFMKGDAGAPVNRGWAEHGS